MQSRTHTVTKLRKWYQTSTYLNITATLILVIVSTITYWAPPHVITHVISTLLLLLAGSLLIAETVIASKNKKLENELDDLERINQTDMENQLVHILQRFKAFCNANPGTGMNIDGLIEYIEGHGNIV